MTTLTLRDVSCSQNHIDLINGFEFLETINFEDFHVLGVRNTDLITNNNHIKNISIISDVELAPDTVVEVVQKSAILENLVVSNVKMTENTFEALVNIIQSREQRNLLTINVRGGGGSIQVSKERMEATKYFFKIQII